MLNTVFEYEIARTGELQIQYTLYKHVIVYDENFGFSRRMYMQNVGATEQIAITTAERVSGGNIDRAVALPNGTKIFLYLLESPKAVYQDIKAFNLRWKKTPKGYYSTPDKLFWDKWKVEKDSIKARGFRVFKGDDGEFIVFISHKSLEGLCGAAHE